MTDDFLDGFARGRSSVGKRSRLPAASGSRNGRVEKRNRSSDKSDPQKDSLKSTTDSSKKPQHSNGSEKPHGSTTARKAASKRDESSDKKDGDEKPSASKLWNSSDKDKKKDEQAVRKPPKPVVKDDSKVQDVMPSKGNAKSGYTSSSSSTSNKIKENEQRVQQEKPPLNSKKEGRSGGSDKVKDKDVNNSTTKKTSMSRTLKPAESPGKAKEQRRDLVKNAKAKSDVDKHRSRSRASSDRLKHRTETEIRKSSKLEHKGYSRHSSSKRQSSVKHSSRSSSGRKVVESDRRSAKSIERHRHTKRWSYRDIRKTRDHRSRFGHATSSRSSKDSKLDANDGRPNNGDCKAQRGSPFKLSNQERNQQFPEDRGSKVGKYLVAERKGCFPLFLPASSHDGSRDPQNPTAELSSVVESYSEDQHKSCFPLFPVASSCGSTGAPQLFNAELHRNWDEPLGVSGAGHRITANKDDSLSTTSSWRRSHSGSHGDHQPENCMQPRFEYESQARSSPIGRRSRRSARLNGFLFYWRKRNAMPTVRDWKSFQKKERRRAVFANNKAIGMGRAVTSRSAHIPLDVAMDYSQVCTMLEQTGVSANRVSQTGRFRQQEAPNGVRTPSQLMKTEPRECNAAESVDNQDYAPYAVPKDKSDGGITDESDNDPFMTMSKCGRHGRPGNSRSYHHRAEEEYTEDFGPSQSANDEFQGGEHMFGRRPQSEDSGTVHDVHMPPVEEQLFLGKDCHWAKHMLGNGNDDDCTLTYARDYDIDTEDTKPSYSRNQAVTSSSKSDMMFHQNFEQQLFGEDSRFAGRSSLSLVNQVGACTRKRSIINEAEDTHGGNFESKKARDGSCPSRHRPRQHSSPHSYDRRHSPARAQMEMRAKRHKESPTSVVQAPIELKRTMAKNGSQCSDAADGFEAPHQERCLGNGHGLPLQDRQETWSSECGHRSEQGPSQSGWNEMRGPEATENLDCGCEDASFVSRRGRCAGRSTNPTSDLKSSVSVASRDQLSDFGRFAWVPLSSDVLLSQNPTYPHDTVAGQKLMEIRACLEKLADNTGRTIQELVESVVHGSCADHADPSDRTLVLPSLVDSADPIDDLYRHSVDARSFENAVKVQSTSSYGGHALNSCRLSEYPLNLTSMHDAARFAPMQASGAQFLLSGPVLNTTPNRVAGEPVAPAAHLPINEVNPLVEARKLYDQLQQINRHFAAVSDHCSRSVSNFSSVNPNSGRHPDMGTSLGHHGVLQQFANQHCCQPSAPVGGRAGSGSATVLATPPPPPELCNSGGIRQHQEVTPAAGAFVAANGMTSSVSHYRLLGQENGNTGADHAKGLLIGQRNIKVEGFETGGYNTGDSSCGQPQMMPGQGSVGQSSWEQHRDGQNQDGNGYPISFSPCSSTDSAGRSSSSVSPGTSPIRLIGEELI